MGGNDVMWGKFSTFFFARKIFLQKVEMTLNIYAYLVFFFKYTSAFRRKSTQKLTDVPQAKEKFSFPLLRKKLQTLTTRDCKGPQTNMPEDVGSIKT